VQRKSQQDTHTYNKSRNIMTTPVTGGWSSSTSLNESKKLKPHEADWNLAGISSTTTTRTRHNGQGRPNLQRNEPIIEVENLESSDSEYMYEESSSLPDEEEEDDEEDEDNNKKPPASHVLILDVSVLTAMPEAFFFSEMWG
jgi:hypothetical protein